MANSLIEFYESLDVAVNELYEVHPWMPCRSCPVIGKEENCCNYALFLVTKTEWERMKLSPFIIKNRKRLKNDARETIKSLQNAGYDTTDWGATVKRFGDSHNPIKFRCPLLSGDGWCEIYRDRPAVCRMYGVTFQADQTAYGCSIVAETVDEKLAEGVGVKKHDLKPMLDHMITFVKGPAKPIVAWLTEL